MIIDGASAAAQRSRIAYLGSKTLAAYPYVHIAAYALAFHFVRLVADTKRKNIGTREDGIHLNFAPIHATRPAALRLAEIQSVALAVNVDLVSHECVLKDRRLERARLQSRRPGLIMAGSLELRENYH
jgi:hypothetical protein